MSKVLYRIEYYYNYFDEHSDSLFSKQCGYKLEVVKFNILSETPCGYWIDLLSGSYATKKKWVSKTAKKRYAYDTIQGARVNFIKRNEKRLQILETQVHQVKEALRLIETFYKPKQTP